MTESKTIDMTPTWSQLMPMLVEVAANGDTVEGRKASMAELMRLAQQVDAQNAKAKEETANPPLPCFTTLHDLDKATYDGVEVNPVARRNGGYEMCSAGDPDLAVWSAYLHCVEGGVECAGDFETAEEAYAYAKFLEAWLGDHCKHPR